MLKERLKPMLLYLIVIFAAFYLLPIIIPKAWLLILLLPLVCFGMPFLFALKRGIDLILPVVVLLLFIPALLIFGIAVWYCMLIYGFLALFGVVAGRLVKLQRNAK